MIQVLSRSIYREFANLDAVREFFSILSRARSMTGPKFRLFPRMCDTDILKAAGGNAVFKFLYYCRKLFHTYRVLE